MAGHRLNNGNYLVAHPVAAVICGLVESERVFREQMTKQTNILLLFLQVNRGAVVSIEIFALVPAVAISAFLKGRI